MKKILLTMLCCLLCVSATAFAQEFPMLQCTPVPAPSGVQAILSATGDYEGYAIIADDGNDVVPTDMGSFQVNHAALDNGEQAVLLVARQQEDEWQLMNTSVTALFQPGQTDKPLYLWQSGGGFDVCYGAEDAGSESYSFSYDEKLDEYVLFQVNLYTQRKYYNNNFHPHTQGLLFWQSGPERSFVPVGEAIWYTDGITLSEFNIAQMPRSMAEVRHVNLTAQALAETSLPLVAQKETFITDEPTGSQRALFTIPAGTELAGLARCGEFYAEVEWTQEGQKITGFVPMKALLPKYDRQLSAADDLLMADVRWDVVDALCGKWFPMGRAHDEESLLIFFNEGSYRTSRLLTEENMPEGNFRVYDVENGDGSTYELCLFAEDNSSTCFTMRLNEDGTITLTQNGVEIVYDRNEYSSYGNG